MKNQLTAERLRELLHYCPETGLFTWIVARRRKQAGRVNCFGYRLIPIDGQKYRAHRLAFLYVTGQWPSDQVDHCDGDRDNNRWSNLRECNNRENSQNRKVRSDNTSGYPGVTWNKKASLWQAQVKHMGKNHIAGYCESPEAAFAAYKAKKAELHRFNPGCRTRHETMHEVQNGATL